MVQGLGFLSKKSWHTKNLNNQEKVWIAEQQQEQERIRTSELAKQIQIEREQNEIDDITGGGDGGGDRKKKKKIYDRGIDWMYTGQTKDSQIAKEDALKIAEEYLLGKPIAFHGAVAVTETTTGTQLPVVSAAAATSPITGTIEDTKAEFEHNIYGDQDIPTFKKNHKYEDPMYAVSLQTLRKEKMIEQQKELYQKVGMTTMTTRRNDNDDNDDDIQDGNNVDNTMQKSKSKMKKSKKYDSRNNEEKDDESSLEESRAARPRCSATACRTLAASPSEQLRLWATTLCIDESCTRSSTLSIADFDTSANVAPRPRA